MNICITGGTGSLGTALIDHYLKHGKHHITVFSRDDTKVNRIASLYPTVRALVGDVEDLGFLQTAFREQDLVIHAAAIKRVPTAESHPLKAIQVNVHGSENVAKAAVGCGVGTLIGISTDKACAPTTLYGNTKALMEGIFREAATWGSTKVACVRYGNVLRSAGSVVPLWDRQISAGSPITLTAGHMTRFWLTMLDAIALIQRGIFHAEKGISGSIVVPKARSMRMDALAKAVAGDDYPIEVLGARAGEKFHEDLLNDIEASHTYESGEDFVILPPTGGDLPRRATTWASYHSAHPEVMTLTTEQIKTMLAAWTPPAYIY